MGTARPHPWWRKWPPLLTVATVGFLIAASGLVGIRASTGTALSKAFVADNQWLIWRAAAGATVLLSVMLLVYAVEILRTSKHWGLVSSTRRLWLYLVLAAVGVLIFWLALFLGARHLPGLPIRGQHVRTGMVQTIALIASVPWLAIVWLAGTECTDLKEKILALPADGLDAAKTPVERKQYGDIIRQLLELRRLLMKSVTAFVLGVVAAIVTTGALRAAFLSAYPARADQFPVAAVLLYGGLFAAVLSVITLPLAASWWERARQVVERTYPLPPDGQPSEAWMSARTRLEHLLRLDVSLLAYLTAVSILAPLITAVLAVVIPRH